MYFDFGIVGVPKGVIFIVSTSFSNLVNLVYASILQLCISYQWMFIFRFSHPNGMKLGLLKELNFDADVLVARFPLRILLSKTKSTSGITKCPATVSAQSKLLIESFLTYPIGTIWEYTDTLSPSYNNRLLEIFDHEWKSTRCIGHGVSPVKDNESIILYVTKQLLSYYFWSSSIISLILVRLLLVESIRCSNSLNLYHIFFL